jgi:hypothetical protein
MFGRTEISKIEKSVSNRFRIALDASVRLFIFLMDTRIVLLKYNESGRHQKSGLLKQKQKYPEFQIRPN